MIMSLRRLRLGRHNPVAQISNLLYRRFLIGRSSGVSRLGWIVFGPARWKRAIQQIGNLRYGATGERVASPERRSLIQRANRFAAVALVSLTIAGDIHASGYDPLAVAAGENPSKIDLTVHDAARDRDLPLRVYLPTNTAPGPVILFSHGLGGSRTGSVFLGEHWAARGYVAVFVQHPGSDDSVWRNPSSGNRLQSLKQAAS